MIALRWLCLACLLGRRVRGQTRGANESAKKVPARFLYRHNCAGIALAAAPDDIGCAREHLRSFEHVLTPARLWCTPSTCVSEFGRTYSVHAIDCTEQRCVAQLHCDDMARDLLCATLVTIGGVLFVVAGARMCAHNVARRQREKVI